MKRSLVALSFVLAACSSSPIVDPLRDGGVQLSLQIIPQPIVVLTAGAATSFEVVVIGTLPTTGPPTIIGVGALPSGFTASSVTWNGESTLTLTITASDAVPISEFRANVIATVDTASVGAAPTTVVVSATDGAPDATFGTGGMEAIALASPVSGTDFAPAGNDEWLLAGSVYAQSHGFVARLQSNGSVDSTFASPTLDAVVSLDVDANGDALAVTANGASGAAAIIDATGNATIIPSLDGSYFGRWDGAGAFIAGTSFFHLDASHQVTPSTLSDNTTLIALLSYQGAAYVSLATSAIVRLSSTTPGVYAFDPTFGGASGVTTSGNITRLAADAAGNILAGWGDSSLWLARYTPDGSIDTTFGDKGLANVDTGDTDTVVPISIFPLASGKTLLVAAITSQTSNTSGIMIARLTDVGYADITFGAYGRTRTELVHPLDLFGAAFDESAHRLCTASNVATSPPGVMLACYHVDP